MASLSEVLSARAQRAIAAAFGPTYADTDPVVRRSEHADFQINAAMALAKQVDQAPRAIAELIIEHFDREDIAALEVAGPGFINLTLADDLLAQLVTETTAEPSAAPHRVVVDYSAPNLAKEMHVGHLRSTIIGDAIVRLLRFRGHTVIAQNHVGDWGTQFGMLIEYLIQEDLHLDESHGISDLNALYQRAQERFRSDPEFAQHARQRVVELQTGEPEVVARWQELVGESTRHYRAVYQALAVLLSDDDLRGESAYNGQLQATVDELKEKSLLRLDDDAWCAFPEGFTGRDGTPSPLILQKRDGGFNYAATDLAALRYRVEVLHADRIAYVVDVRQSRHFAMVFAVAREAGWLPEKVHAEHVAFGTILGADGKPFKTREGGTVPLMSVIDEAIDRARVIVSEKNPQLSSDERDQLARVIGIGALKYGDLSHDRTKDYVFDWERMLSFDGNTAPYLQYAVARIRSVFRQAGVEPASTPHDIRITHDAERALVLELLQFPDVVAAVESTLEPHRLCGYLYDLATAFTKFYEACPILKSEEPVRTSRLVLADLTAQLLVNGLELLGIETPERM